MNGCSPLRVPKVPGLKKPQPVTWELGMGYVGMFFGVILVVSYGGYL